MQWSSAFAFAGGGSVVLSGTTKVESAHPATASANPASSNRFLIGLV